MLKICNNNREEIENEYLALMLNRPELLDQSQILPKYLSNEDNQIILDVAKRCYEKYKYIKPSLFNEFNEHINYNKYIELLTDTFYYNNNFKEQIKDNETSIVNFYKEDIINNLNEKIKTKEFNYSEYMSKMKKLDDIQLSYDSTTLTFQEITENLEEKGKIHFNRFKKLDEIVKLVKGDFLIIGATTGAGKSGFLLNLMEDLTNEYQCIYFNMEMSKQSIYSRIVSIHTDMTLNDVLKPQTEYQSKMIQERMKTIPFENIIIEHKATDIKQIKSLIAKSKKKDKHTIVFIDHLGLTKSDKTKSLYEQATEVAKELRQICLDYDCTVIGASQLNRSAYSSEEITLAMLKDSGELENSASKVILLHKQQSPKEAITKLDIEVAKNRDGQTGFIQMEYNKAKQIFKEVAQ